MSTRFDLTNEESAPIGPSPPQGLRGARQVDERRVSSGIFHVLRTGGPWWRIALDGSHHATNLLNSTEMLPMVTP